MNPEEFQTLVALEPLWTVSVNGAEFLKVPTTEIRTHDGILQIGRLLRKIVSLEPLRPSVIRVRARTPRKRQPDTLMFYAGDTVPSAAALRQRRRAFLNLLKPALERHFGARVSREILQTDTQRSISGAYPRLLLGNSWAVMAVDPDESSPVVNAVIRAAVLWSSSAKRRVAVVVPCGRAATIAARIRAIPALQTRFTWLEWNGDTLRPLDWNSEEVVTDVCAYRPPEAAVMTEVRRIVALAPDVLTAVPQIAGRSVSVRLRGLEVAHVGEAGTSYPLGEPLEALVTRLAAERRAGSRHPLARVHEEAWLESNLIAQIETLLPAQRRHLYPQVPSFAGEDRRIIDILTVLDTGRLAVIEVKVSADPDLPFQALDYWLAVERHRKAGDFEARGYFEGVALRDEPAILVIVAPLLQFHRTLGRLTALLPPEVPLLQIGVNQGWKKEIKVLRRKGPVS